jgi:hypothetical protein
MIGKKINQLATELAPATTDLTIIGDPVTGVSKKITLLQIADLFATLGTVTSVAVTETGNALTITGSPITSAGTINIGFAGAANQYVRGDGQLSDFPTSTGGGSSVSYYLNSSVSQGTLGGVAYRQFSKTPIAGAGTDITISANGYIASYITDANDPALLEVPAGNFNCELYFSVNSNNHNPYVYAEVYKYDGTTFTLLGSSQSVPEYLTNGTTLSPYYFAVPITATVLTITDRIAIRIYANVDTKTVTLHTENSHLCQVVTTFSNGLTSLNNLTRQVQFLATGTSGTDFNIASSTATHTFNLPTASATNRGALSSADFTTFNNKQNALTLTTTGSSGAATLVGATLNIPNYGSALTGYVPYTGATANVDLGTFELSSRSVFIEGTASYQSGLLIKQRGLYNFVTGAYTQIVADSATDLNIVHNQANTTRRRYALSVAALQDGDSFQYAVPRASGTIALTSNLAAYLPLAGGTMTGAIIGTTSTFTNAGSGVGVEITNSSTGDGLKINHSSGRALNIASSGSGFGIIINNSTASTSAPFTIQKQGSNVITLSDNGAANFSGQLTLGSTITNGTNTYTLPGASGTLALTSALSGYLPLTGGTLTGALGGTSATFSGALTAVNISNNGIYYGRANASFPATSLGYFALKTNNIDGERGGLTVQVSNTTSTFIDALTINYTGAATFSSSVTSNGNTNGQIAISPSTNTNAAAFVASNAGGGCYFGKNNSTGGAFTGTAYATVVYSGGDVPMAFYTNDAEKMRITSGGDLFLGTTTNDIGKLQIQTSGDGSSFSHSLLLKDNSTNQNAFLVSHKSGETRLMTTWSGSGINSDMTFWTTTSSGSQSERMRITSEGTVLVNQTSLSAASAGQKMQIATDVLSTGSLAGYFWENRSGGVTSSSNWYGWYTSAGTIFLYNGSANAASINPTTGIYTPLSDVNKKKDFEDSTIGLNAILGLKPTLYRMKSENGTEKHLGFIAQEVKEFIPQAYIQTKGEKEDFIGIDDRPIIAALVKGMQELKQELDTLKNK